jgi:hypothetical protein
MRYKELVRAQDLRNSAGIFIDSVYCPCYTPRSLWLFLTTKRRDGGMAEWTMATVLKTVVGVSSPGVRIPLPPLENNFDNWGDARVVEWGRLLSG